MLTLLRDCALQTQAVPRREHLLMLCISNASFDGTNMRCGCRLGTEKAKSNMLPLAMPGCHMQKGDEHTLGSLHLCNFVRERAVEGKCQ